jgi:hypothetical protein
MPLVCDLVAAVVVVVVVPEPFVGEPAPKFHTLRTIDLAEEKNPKRGFALPLSVANGGSSVGRRAIFETGKRTVRGLRPSGAHSTVPATPSLLLSRIEHLPCGCSFPCGLFLFCLRLPG